MSAKSTCRDQHGAALIVSMVMLAVITLIGAMVMNSSRLEWLITNNNRFQNDAYMWAEATLIEAENDVKTHFSFYPNPLPTFVWSNPGDQYYNPLPTGLDLSQPDQWNGAFYKQSYTPTGAPVGITSDYVVEYLGCALTSFDPPHDCGDGGVISIVTFRIWARSTDPATGSTSIIQSILSGATTAQGINFTITYPRTGFAEITE